MQIYHVAVFNHFRALQGWAAGTDAKLTLDLRNFELEVKYRGRYYNLHPLFQMQANGQPAHTHVLPQDIAGFGGWRPYRSFTHGHASDKLAFKRLLAEAGLRTPDFADPIDPPDFDHVLKASTGSFGKQLAGPFRAGEAPGAQLAWREQRPGAVFAERFIEGEALKVWFWGAKPFFAHAHGRPTITGDGTATVEQLITRRMQDLRTGWARHPDRGLVEQCLRYQGFALDTVLPHGSTAWMDYRYAQRYELLRGVTPHSDSALPGLLQATGTQLGDMGQVLEALLRPSMPAPVLITVDGVLDEAGHIWWLEMNTNSVLPPEGYAVMFGDLFG